MNRHPKVHYVKCWPEFFLPLEAGIKNFEIRYDDRIFEPGDIIVNQRYDPATKTYSGHEVVHLITYTLHPSAEIIGLQPGYVILSLRGKHSFLSGGVNDEIAKSLYGL